MRLRPVGLVDLAHELRERGAGRFRETHGPAALLVVGFHAEDLPPTSRLRKDRTGVYRVEDVEARERRSRVGSASELLLPNPLVGNLLPLGATSREVVLGRDPACDIALADHLVSRRHCAFRLGGSAVELIDLGSRNGTLLDGVRLQPNRPRALRDGAILRVGSHRFRFITCESLCEKLRAAPAPAT